MRYVESDTRNRFGSLIFRHFWLALLTIIVAARQFEVKNFYSEISKQQLVDSISTTWFVGISELVVTLPMRDTNCFSVIPATLGYCLKRVIDLRPRPHNLHKVTLSPTVTTTMWPNHAQSKHQYRKVDLQNWQESLVGIPLPGKWQHALLKHPTAGRRNSHLLLRCSWTAGKMNGYVLPHSSSRPPDGALSEVAEPDPWSVTDKEKEDPKNCMEPATWLHILRRDIRNEV